MLFDFLDIDGWTEFVANAPLFIDASVFESRDPIVQVFHKNNGISTNNVI